MLNAHVELFFGAGGRGWIDKATKDMQSAESIWLSTTLYDDEKMHTALLEARTRQCPTHVLVDAQGLRDKSCSGEKTKLLELQKAKARVLLCTGTDGVAVYGRGALPGLYHVKILCLDEGRIVYHGGSNATKSSRKNIEAMTKLQGPAGVHFYRGLVEQAKKGRAM